MKMIVPVGGDPLKRELIVWLYLNQAIFSLLRLFSAAGQLVFPFHLSFDHAFHAVLSNSESVCTVCSPDLVEIATIPGSTKGMTFMMQG